MANSNSCLRFFYILLICTVVIQIQAYPLHGPILLASRARALLRVPRTTAPSCGIEGNPDNHGPGIRIGIYCQTIAVWLTTNFLVSQSHILRNSVTVFSIALLAICLVRAVNAPSTYAVEFFIVLQLFSWNCLSNIRLQSMSTQSNLPSQNKTLQRFFTKALTIAAVVMHTWFWFIGLDSMQKPASVSSCTDTNTVSVFFFARVDIDGWFRELMKGLAVLGVLDQISFFLTQLFGLWTSGTASQQKKLAAQAVEHYELWKTTSLSHSFPGPTIPAPNDEEDIGTAAWPTVSYAASEADTCSQTMSPTWYTHTINGNRISVSTVGASTHDGDEESISEKVERILYQTELVKEDVMEIPNTPWTPGRLPSWHEPESPTIPEAPCPIFEEICEAEVWVKKCVDAGDVACFQGQYPRAYKVMVGLGIIPRNLPPEGKEEEKEERDDDTVTYHSGRSSTSGSTSSSNPPQPSPPYTTCLVSLLTAILTFRFPRRAATLWTHLHHSNALNLVAAPYQLHAALTSSYPSASPKPLPPHTSLPLASNLLLTSLPPPTQSKQKSRYTRAVVDTLIHIFLILQLELTIHWNGVRGLGAGGLGSMGQVLPAVIGIVGLGVVVWRGVWQVVRGKGVEADSDDEVVDRMEQRERVKWMEVYEEWKEWRDGDGKSLY